MKLHLLPGTMCDAALWQGLGRSLPAHYEWQHVPIEQCASPADAMAVIAQCNTEPMHLVGFSMGGYLALQYALQHRDNVHSLVIIAASAGGLDTAEQQARDKIIVWLKNNPYQGMTRKRMREFVYPERLADPEVTDVIRQMEARLGQETLISQMTGMSRRQALTTQLGMIQCPVLLVAADSDQKVPLMVMETMHEALPNSRLEVLTNCGHMIPLEQPANLAAQMHQFYASLP